MQRNPKPSARARPAPRSNRERTETTRQALLDAARGLFVQHGYADTATPQVCAAAGITRGALYHHFVDKRDLFRQLLLREAQAVADAIAAATPAGLDARRALLAGGEAYLDAMRVPGRTRLLLVEGPAALGAAEMRALDEAHAAASLREGLREAGLALPAATAAAVASLLSAAFDRAALDMDGGADARAVRAGMQWLLRRLLPADAAPATATAAAKPRRR
jgi:AcrR family transcriptional regulator